VVYVAEGQGFLHTKTGAKGYLGDAKKYTTSLERRQKMDWRQSEAYYYYYYQ
jgi:hypothetical protein